MDLVLPSQVRKEIVLKVIPVREIVLKGILSSASSGNRYSGQ